MKPLLVSLLVVVAALPAQAQVYKCVKNGATSYQARPCDEDSSSATALNISIGGMPWEGIRAGLTPEEVGRAVGAVRADGAPLASGAKLALKKPGIQIADMAFTAHYYFVDNKQLALVSLERVRVNESGTPETPPNDVNLADYKKLVASFRAKYGSDSGSAMKNAVAGVNGLSANTEWAVSGGTVFVNITPLTLATSVLKCGFRPAEKKD